MEFTLEQRGTALVFKSPKLVVNVNRPRVRPIYDQCGILAYVKTAGSYSLSGRATCEARMIEIMRLSYSYLQAAPEIADTANDISFANIRAASNILVETNFSNLPQNPVEVSTNRARYPLEDACNDPIGFVEQVTATRFRFGTDCRVSVLTSLATKLAVNESITNPEAIHTALGGFFEDTVKTGGSQAATSTAWSNLAGTITVALPGFEP